ncbi:MAG TPA: HEPN domain-containing protein [Candidatus Brocadiia bacterium]|nr:HEPN domain-containing protein [Candidatus Brocadiia bacterium]
MAINAKEHGRFWRDGAEEDMAAASDLVGRGRFRHGLFFAHLAVEKMLKALATESTGEFPPRTHDLLRLADIAGLDMSDARRKTLARLQRFCLEGRYPDLSQTRISPEDAQAALDEAKEAVSWLMNQSDRQ